MKLLQRFLAEDGYINERLVLQRIIDNDGKADPSDIFVLSKMSEFFKHEDAVPSEFFLSNNGIGLDSHASDAEAVDALRAMSNEERVKLAHHLMQCMDKSAKMPKFPEGMVITTTDWMNMVTKMRNDK
jgi:uncharacterized tellurite resistance protein B-like protein